MNAPALTRTAIDPISGQQVEIRNDLTKRLRGQYAMGPTLPSGEPEFGWRSFGEPVPIQVEAANEIERLTNALISLNGKDWETELRIVNYARSKAEKRS